MTSGHFPDVEGNVPEVESKGNGETGTCWQTQHPDRGSPERERGERRAGCSQRRHWPWARLCGGSVWGTGDVPVNCTELRRRAANVIGEAWARRWDKQAGGSGGLESGGTGALISRSEMARTTDVGW